VTGRFPTKEITYNAQLAAVNRAFEACHVQSKKKTHAGRGSGARYAEENGAEIDDVRRHGRWSNDVMETWYLTALPRGAIRVMAGFPADRGQYWLPRSSVDPPEALTARIFPEVDGWLQKVEAGQEAESTICAQGFLRLLQRMRKVLVQDVACLRQLIPNHAILNHDIFQSVEFLTFCDTLHEHSQNESTPADLRLATVIPDVSCRLDAIYQQNEIHYDTLRTHLDTSLNTLKKTVDSLVDGTTSFRLVPVDGYSGSSTTSPTSSPTTAAITTAPQPLSEEDRREDSSPAPYEFGKFSSIPDVWKEWKLGVRGQPPIEALEKRFKAKWRKTDKARQAFHRRKALVDEVGRLVASKEAPNEQEAVELLEGKRRIEQISVDKFVKNMKRRRLTSP